MTPYSDQSRAPQVSLQRFFRFYLESLHDVGGDPEVDDHGPLGCDKALELILCSVAGVHVGRDLCADIRAGLIWLAPEKRREIINKLKIMKI
jgi:hypothetical protein